MNDSYKICILKLVIDLIKVDNKIHKDEIGLIEELLSQYNYTQEELQIAHYTSLQDAISTLQQQSHAERIETINTLKKIVTIDNDIAIDERILLGCIQLALQEETRNKIQIITTDSTSFDNYDRQLMYLEQKSNTTATCIKEHEAAIRQHLSSWGIDFFFLPQVLSVLTRPTSHTTSVINLLFPTFTHINEEEKKHLIDFLSISEYSNYLHKLMGKEVEPFKFDNFFMLKIQSSHNIQQHTTDFICIDCSGSPIKSIEQLIKSLSIELIADTIPYEGCYRTLFELISERSKQEYSLLLNGDTFCLNDAHNTPLEISGSERKTLFSLFLLHGEEGISNNTFATLSKDSPLGREAITIYRYFANEKSYEQMERLLQENQEPSVITNLRDITKRNSHIGYIKRAFIAIRSLKNPHKYYPCNIKGEYTYNITLSPSLISAKRQYNNTAEPLTLSFFK